jgi:hypothetical protein
MRLESGYNHEIKKYHHISKHVLPQAADRAALKKEQGLELYAHKICYGNFFFTFFVCLTTQMYYKNSSLNE